LQAKGMNLKQLECFVQVAEFGSFSRGALFLSIPQPVLSRYVRQLEMDLRQTLLIRTGRGVTPTEAGKLFLSHARGILHQVARAREEVEEIRGTPVGQVAIGFPPTLGRVLTVPLVTEFRVRFPKAQLKIIEGLSIHLLDWLGTGRLDVALAYNVIWTPHFEIAPLLEEPLYLICPGSGGASSLQAGAPVTFVELPGYPLIIPSRPNAMRMFIEAQLANAGVKMNVAWEVDGIPPILDLVHQGYGYAVLPLTAIHEDLVLGPFVARPIMEPDLIIPLSLVTSSQRPMTPLVRQVVDLLRQAVRKRLTPEHR
jgi:LysR family transcriptional regulator, nitrogen assimilation regulatory protein